MSAQNELSMKKLSNRRSPFFLLPHRNETGKSEFDIPRVYIGARNKPDSVRTTMELLNIVGLIV